MAIECFNEIYNIVYIAKKLYDMGKYELVKESFFDSLDYDVYFENMYGLIDKLFAYHVCYYYENKMLELHVLSDPVVVDFYTLAGEYGRLCNIADDANPFFKEAERQVHKQLNFSYCLDWMVMGHAEPKPPYHSRLGIFISQEDWVDCGCLAYGLIEIYEWFADACVELNKKLHGDTQIVALNLKEEAIAA